MSGYKNIDTSTKNKYKPCPNFTCSHQHQKSKLYPICVQFKKMHVDDLRELTSTKRIKCVDTEANSEQYYNVCISTERVYDDDSIEALRNKYGEFVDISDTDDCICNKRVNRNLFESILSFVRYLFCCKKSKSNIRYHVHKNREKI